MCDLCWYFLSAVNIRSKAEQGYNKLGSIALTGMWCLIRLISPMEEAIFLQTLPTLRLANVDTNGFSWCYLQHLEYKTFWTRLLDSLSNPKRHSQMIFLFLGGWVDELLIIGACSTRKNFDFLEPLKRP